MSRRRSDLLDILFNSPAYKAAAMPYEDKELANVEPFPFLGIVGQSEMKLALLLALINPMVGGVLLLGPRGTAKTTAVRSLVDLLPRVKESLCINGEGCTEEMVEEYGMSAVCNDCAKKFGYGEPLTDEKKVHLVELPLNARLEDVVGGIDERAALERQKVLLKRGILAQADGNLLYIDEVNLLPNEIIDVILDAAAQGFHIVRRGPMSLTYNARFMLIGSMNPEEGQLRPQIMDRFGLRAKVMGLTDPEQRYAAYEVAIRYKQNPGQVAAQFAEHTLAMAEEIQLARALLPQVKVSEEAKRLGISLVAKLSIASNRSEISMFEAARAYAAAAGRTEVEPDDVRAVALLALRLRQSESLDAFFESQEKEDEKVVQAFDELMGNEGQLAEEDVLPTIDAAETLLGSLVSGHDKE
ncbi:MAG TPA: ATP-binding protein [Anaerolineae bacterium]|nr:ATP-binding protein [Anaerolineae bacterium]